MKLPSLFQFRILKEALKALFMGPYTTKFPYEPYTPPEKYRGKPEFSKEDCVGCTACAQVCPCDAIEVLDEGGVRKLIHHQDLCIFCGQCEASCITEKGIKLTGEYDLAVFDRSQAATSVEKELLTCEYCGCVVGPVDHIKFLARKLGPAAYSNPTLILTALKDLSKDIVTTNKEKGVPVSRADNMRILCPRCRREVFLFEIS